MAVQKQDDQHEHTFRSYVRIRDVVLKTYLGRWTIGRSGERGSGISVLPARYDDDDDLSYDFYFQDAFSGSLFVLKFILVILTPFAVVIYLCWLLDCWLCWLSGYHTTITWWSFFGVWVTAILLWSPVFTVFRPISTMLESACSWIFLRIPILLMLFLTNWR